MWEEYKMSLSNRMSTHTLATCIAATACATTLFITESFAWLGGGTPPGCSSTGPSVSIQPRIGGNPVPVGTKVFAGQQIIYREFLTNPLPTNCDYLGGDLGGTLPNNQF